MNQSSKMAHPLSAGFLFSQLYFEFSKSRQGVLCAFLSHPMCTQKEYSKDLVFLTNIIGTISKAYGKGQYHVAPAKPRSRNGCH